MAPEIGVIFDRIGVDRDKQHVFVFVEDILRPVAVVVINIEDRDRANPAQGCLACNNRGIVEIAIAAKIIAPAMVARWAAQGKGAAGIAAGHCFKRAQRALRPPIGRLPRARCNRRGGIKAILADPRIDPFVIERAAGAHRKGISDRIAAAPLGEPFIMRALQESDVIGIVHRQNRIYAEIARRQRIAQRAQNRIKPRRRFGKIDPFAIIQLAQRRVGGLVWAEKGLHHRHLFACLNRFRPHIGSERGINSESKNRPILPLIRGCSVENSPFLPRDCLHLAQGCIAMPLPASDRLIRG